MSHQRFFDADEDKDLAKAISDAEKQLDQSDDLLDQFDDLFLADFSNSRWKVIFSDKFLKSYKKLESKRAKTSVINLLHNISSGWRAKKSKNSPHMVKQFRVEGLFVICSRDIVKESKYTQVLKIWDILPPGDIPEIMKRLDRIFGSYTDDFISRFSKRCIEADLEVPMTWEKSTEIIKFKNLDNNGNEAESSGCDQRTYVENSKVEESLLLMKFYSLSSSAVVRHLLSDRSELDLPIFEVSDEERDIILFSKSTFVLGRSGTGKTTVLTMKLFHQENLHHMVQEDRHKDSSTVNDRPVLHQLYVTVSPTLCQAVKQHVVRLKRCGTSTSDYRPFFDLLVR